MFLFSVVLIVICDCGIVLVDCVAVRFFFSAGMCVCVCVRIFLCVSFFCLRVCVCVDSLCVSFFFCVCVCICELFFLFLSVCVGIHICCWSPKEIQGFISNLTKSLDWFIYPSLRNFTSPNSEKINQKKRKKKPKKKPSPIFERSCLRERLWHWEREREKARDRETEIEGETEIDDDEERSVPYWFLIKQTYVEDFSSLWNFDWIDSV